MKITLEQVIQEFDSKIDSVIRNFDLMDIEDIKQDIYMDIFRRGYLKKYKSHKGALSTYIYTFLRNHCKNTKRNLFFKKRFGRLNSVSLQQPVAHSRSEYARYDTLSDILPSSLNILNEIEKNNFLDKLREEIGHNKMYIIHSRKKGQINLKKVIDLLVLGYNIREIAKKMGISDLVLIKKFRRLSSRPWIREYFNINVRDNGTSERAAKLRRSAYLGMSYKF